MIVTLNRSATTATSSEGSFFDHQWWLDLWDNFSTALLTAVLVGGAAGLAVQRAQRSSAERAQRSEIARDFGSRVARCAQSFYVAAQHYWRCTRDPTRYGRPDRVEFTAEYKQFRSDALTLEAELSARYGEKSAPRHLWHRIDDLLTVRYFDLIARPGRPGPDIFENNAGDAHTGLSADQLRVPATLFAQYHATMRQLGQVLDDAAKNDPVPLEQAEADLAHDDVEGSAPPRTAVDATT